MVKNDWAVPALVLLSVVFWVANYIYPNVYLNKLFYTAFAFAITDIIFTFFIQKLVTRLLKESKAGYYLKKMVSTLHYGAFAVILLAIWVDLQVFLLGISFIAASIVITAGDIFRNLFGGVFILVSKIYDVGDRIEIGSKCGDVIDIDLFYTTLLEIKEWVAGDQATGRLTIVPNGQVLSGVVNNYTKDHEFIWDEIHLPITYDSDWKLAHDAFLRVVKKQTGEVEKHAGVEMEGLARKYYMTKRDTEPAIFLTLTDNWVMFNIRYITPARKRRAMADSLSRLLLEEIGKSKKIKVASTTLDIVGFPKMKPQSRA